MVPLDWQFVVVTLVAMVAAAVLVRRLAPARKTGSSKADPACAHCASNPQQRHTTPARAPRTTTTPVVSLSDLRETARKR